jgi:hypothetical protein
MMPREDGMCGIPSGVRPFRKGIIVDAINVFHMLAAVMKLFDEVFGEETPCGRRSWPLG